MKKVFALFLMGICLLLAACSGNQFGSKKEIYDDIELSVDYAQLDTDGVADLGKQSAFYNAVLVKMTIDGTKFDKYPSVYKESFVVKTAGGESLEYAYTIFGDNSFDTVSFSNEDSDTGFASVDKKGTFIYVYKVAKENKEQKFTVTYDNGEKPLTWE